MRRQVFLRARKHVTNTRHRTRLEVDNTQVAQARFGENHTGDRQNRTRDNRTERVGENVLEHNTSIACAERSCRQDIFLVFKAIELHTYARSHTYPPR